MANLVNPSLQSFALALPGLVARNRPPDKARRANAALAHAQKFEKSSKCKPLVESLGVILDKKFLTNVSVCGGNIFVQVIGSVAPGGRSCL
jgi:hypothetical protein